MAFKPNYNFQKAERSRAKAAEEAGKAETSPRGVGEAQGGAGRRAHGYRRRC